MTKKWNSLDFARVVAMLAVIMIHVSSTYIGAPSGYSIFGVNPSFALNQFSRFAVPLFIFMSGLTLALNDRPMPYAKFIKKRLKKIGIPYLIWCLVYYIYHDGAGLWELKAKGLSNIPAFFQSVLRGDLAPHLYFIVIIVQLYLIFPWLKKWVDAKPVQALIASFALMFCFQEIFMIQYFGLNLVSQTTLASLVRFFPTWIFYFVLGIFITKERLVVLSDFAEQHRISLMVLMVSFAACYVLESKASGYIDSIRPQLLIYVVLVFVCCLGFSPVFEKSKCFLKVNSFLAKHSMTIYFGHVLCLCFLRRFAIFEQGTQGMLLLYVAVFVSAVLIAVVLDFRLPHKTQRSL
ncbi:MAG: acyltransferase [Evtepia sp.]